MAIKNTLLGGTDWIDGESSTAQDRNDTINAAVAYLKSLSAFWLNSFLYTVYDDFESYSVGAFTTNTNWTCTSCAISSSTNAGGTGKEAYASGVGSSLVSNIIPSNRHLFARIYSNPVYGVLPGDDNYSITTATISVGNATDGWTTVLAHTGSVYTQVSRTLAILVIAKGSNVYDVYLGGKVVGSDVSKPNGMQISLTLATDTPGYGSGQIYIDDVRYSANEVV